ncbi:switch-activating protein Sap1 [Kappamyces sp. JEL0829]|nr:switch-activating protein Sap1 [Kappamyces sp. JEL0829]
MKKLDTDEKPSSHEQRNLKRGQQTPKGLALRSLSRSSAKGKSSPGSHTAVAIQAIKKSREGTGSRERGIALLQPSARSNNTFEEYKRMMAAKAGAAKPQEITITIGTIMGKMISVTLWDTDTVAALKDHIAGLEGIAPDSQMLVFCDTHLVDDQATLKSLSIQDQSSLQLILKMAGGLLCLLTIGPGPPIQMKRLPQEEDQVVFLLCKQNQELYVLEVHLKDGERPRTVTKHHLRLQSPTYGNKLIEFLGSNEFFDISDLCELQIDLDGEDCDEVDEHLDYEDDFVDLDDSRPRTADSGVSYVSSAKDSSRPVSGISKASSISTEDEALEKLFWESEWLLSDRLASTSSFTGSPTNLRPATAISIMRLPSGSRPMIIIPKSRPASAEKWIDGFKSHLMSREQPFEDKTPVSRQSLESAPKSKAASPLNFFQSRRSGLSPSLSISRKSNPCSATSQQYKDAPARHGFTPNAQLEPVLHFKSSSRQSSRITTPRKGLPTSRAKTPGKPLITVTKREKTCCLQCNKKLGPAQVFTCKCEQHFCSVHRYSDRHDCKYDYKAAAKPSLVQNNPLVKKEKLLRL